jgi:hypothetical protein
MNSELFQDLAKQFDSKQRFVPWGAMAFFISMVLVYVAIWFSLYALMVRRG